MPVNLKKFYWPILGMLLFLYSCSNLPATLPSNSPVKTEILEMPNFTVQVTPTLSEPTPLPPYEKTIQIFVPAGEFIMGVDLPEGFETNKQMVWVDSFWIDKTEVTTIQFAYFLNDVGYQHNGEITWVITNPFGFSPIIFNGDLWQHAPGFENHPVENVSWQGAKAYCEWAGNRLPTEEEWEKAARWTDGRTYPWGEEVSCNRANYNFGGCKEEAETTPVGSYPLGASPYGVLDMAGNVSEWVDAWINYEDGRMYHVTRGGSYANPAESMKTTSRWGYFGPGNSYGAIGFRCARDGDD